MTSFNAALAARRGLLATAMHETVRLSQPEQAFCALLNGTLTVPELKVTQAGQDLGDQLTVRLENLVRLGCVVDARRG